MVRLNNLLTPARCSYTSRCAGWRWILPCVSTDARTAFQEPSFLFSSSSSFLFKKIARQITLPSLPARHSYLLREKGIRVKLHPYFLPPSFPLFLYISKKKKGKRKYPTTRKRRKNSFFLIAYEKTGKRTKEKMESLQHALLFVFLCAYDPIFGSALSILICFQIIPSDSLQKFPILAFDSKNIPTSFALLSTSSSSLDTRRAAFYRSARERADICSSGVRGRNVGNWGGQLTAIDEDERRTRKEKDNSHHWLAPKCQLTGFVRLRKLIAM